MNKLTLKNLRMLALAALVAPAIAACSTTQVANAIAITTQVEGEIQGGIVSACDTYIPSLEQIGSIASSFVPGASVLDTVINNTINAVCADVAQIVANPTTAAAALTGRPITLVVNGVTVSATYGVRAGGRHR